VEIDRNGLEVLSRKDCLELLATAELGRVAVTSGALPTILPVTFRFDGRQILIRTARGTRLDAATRDSVVAFEADHMGPSGSTGWSVVVTGVARVLTDSDEVAAAQHPSLVRWAPSSDDRIVGISPDVVSGRRVLPGHARVGATLDGPANRSALASRSRCPEG
jgi:nitroimidazol reductase NimA-like FMN-containing flavoprotein (pyridoxamine 5'-phosphate oxidase superfamily)